MKMNLSEIIKLNSLIKTIIDNTDLKIDSLLKFKLLGIMKTLEIPVGNFEKIRNEKIYEYGNTNENGNVEISKDDTEAMDKFMNDIDKLLSTDIEVNLPKLKTTDVFDKCLPADYLVGLYSIIEE